MEATTESHKSNVTNIPDWIPVVASTPITLMTIILLVAIVFAIKWHRQKLRLSKSMPIRRRTWIGDSKRYVDYQARERPRGRMIRTTSTKYNEIYEPWDMSEESRAYDRMHTGAGAGAELGYSHVDRQPDNSWQPSNYSHIDESQIASGDNRRLLPHEQIVEVDIERGNVNTAFEVLTESSDSSNTDSSYDHSSVRNPPKPPKNADSSYDLTAIPPSQTKEDSTKQEGTYDRANLTAVPLRPPQLASEDLARQTYDHTSVRDKDKPPLPQRPPKPKGTEYDHSSTSTASRKHKSAKPTQGYDTPEISEGSAQGQDVSQSTGYDTSSVAGGARPKELMLRSSAVYDKAVVPSGGARPKTRLPSASGYDETSLIGSVRPGKAVPAASGYDETSLVATGKSGKRPKASEYDQSTLSTGMKPKVKVPGYDTATIATSPKAETPGYDECQFTFAEGEEGAEETTESTTTYVQSYSIVSTEDEGLIKSEVRPHLSFKRRGVDTLRPGEEVTQAMPDIAETEQESAATGGEQTISQESIVSQFKENRANIMAKFAIKDDNEQPKDKRHDYFILEKLDDD